MTEFNGNKGVKQSIDMIQTEYSDILTKIAIENGKEIFLNPKKIKAFLSDYTKNEYKKENDFLLSMLKTDCIKYINKAEDLAECKQFLLKRLDEYSLSPTKSAEMLDILFLVLRGVKVQTLNDARKSIARFQMCISIGSDIKSCHVVGLKADGTVEAVGSNDANQCKIRHWRDITAVSAGAGVTAGLKSDGLILIAGANDSGSQINIKGVYVVSVGYSHIAVLRAGGFVDVFGGNNWGQCDTQSWRDIAAVSAGFYHTAGLRGDGTVAAVGHDDYGQCETQGWRDIVAVSAGFGHTVGLKADGTVITVGNKDTGQCYTQNWQDIVAVSAGMAHTVGLKADGTVVVTGSNDFGQCNVHGWQNYIAVRAGLFNTMGLKADGTVVVCGVNKFGQCDTQSWRNIGLTHDERLG
jgi:alpha-tubulin suppressor-like RCC1 family protein